MELEFKADFHSKFERNFVEKKHVYTQQNGKIHFIRIVLKSIKIWKQHINRETKKTVCNFFFVSRLCGYGVCVVCCFIFLLSSSLLTRWLFFRCWCCFFCNCFWWCCILFQYLSVALVALHSLPCIERTTLLRLCACVSVCASVSV